MLRSCCRPTPTPVVEQPTPARPDRSSGYGCCSFCGTRSRNRPRWRARSQGRPHSRVHCSQRLFFLRYKSSSRASKLRPRSSNHLVNEGEVNARLTPTAVAHDLMKDGNAGNTGQPSLPGAHVTTHLENFRAQSWAARSRSDLKLSLHASGREQTTKRVSPNEAHEIRCSGTRTGATLPVGLQMD